MGHKWTERGNSSVPKRSPTLGALEQQMGLARVAPAAGMEGNVLDGCLGGAQAGLQVPAAALSCCPENGTCLGCGRAKQIAGLKEPHGVVPGPDL